MYKVGSYPIQAAPDVKEDFLSFASVFMIVANLGSILCVFMARVVWFAVLVIYILQAIKGKVKILREQMIILLIVVFVSLFSSFLTNTHIGHYSGVFIGCILSLMVIGVNGSNYPLLLNNVYKSCKIVAILGLINIILYFFFPSFFSYAVSESGFGINTICFVFNYQYDTFIVRNQGLYWEPGVFQIVLNIYLYIILFEKRAPYKQIVLPILLILSTFSSTGLIIMSIILFCSFMERRRHKLSINGVLGIFLAALILIPVVYSNVRDKLTTDENPSAALRTYDFVMGLNIIKDYPIWGIGMDPDQFWKKGKAVDIGPYDVSSLNLERGNTNTIVSIGMKFGIPVMFFFFLAMYNQKVFSHKKLFFIIMIIALASEPLFPFPFLFLLVLSSINTSVH